MPSPHEQEPDDYWNVTAECPECGEEAEFAPGDDRVCHACGYGSDEG